MCPVERRQQNLANWQACKPAARALASRQICKLVARSCTLNPCTPTEPARCGIRPYLLGKMPRNHQLSVHGELHAVEEIVVRVRCGLDLFHQCDEWGVERGEEGLQPRHSEAAHETVETWPGESKQWCSWNRGEPLGAVAVVTL